MNNHEPFLLMKLYPYMPISPQNGDAYLNYGQINIYYNNRWNALVDLNQLTDYFQHQTIKSSMVGVQKYSTNLDQILEMMLLLFVKAGVLEDEEQFKDMLMGKKVADKLTDE